jgi:hypothetical protein
MNYTVIPKRRLMRLTAQTIPIAAQMPQPTSNIRDSSICWGQMGDEEDDRGGDAGQSRGARDIHQPTRQDRQKYGCHVAHQPSPVAEGGADELIACGAELSLRYRLNQPGTKPAGQVSCGRRLPTDQTAFGVLPFTFERHSPK